MADEIDKGVFGGIHDARVRVGLGESRDGAAGQHDIADRAESQNQETARHQPPYYGKRMAPSKPGGPVFDTKRIAPMRQGLLAFYDAHKRDLPWAAYQRPV